MSKLQSWEQELIDQQKDRIAELEAENKRLREAIQHWYDYGYNRAKAEALLEGVEEDG